MKSLYEFVNSKDTESLVEFIKENKLDKLDEFKSIDNIIDAINNKSVAKAFYYIQKFVDSNYDEEHKIDSTDKDTINSITDGMFIVYRKGGRNFDNIATIIVPDKGKWIMLNVDNDSKEYWVSTRKIENKELSESLEWNKIVHFDDVNEDIFKIVKDKQKEYMKKYPELSKFNGN